jgi:hypothetical protein
MSLSFFFATLCILIRRNYYEKRAVVRNMLTFMKVIEMIKKLTTNINFRLLIKDRKLDLAEYWDFVYAIVPRLLS